MLPLCVCVFLSIRPSTETNERKVKIRTLGETLVIWLMRKRRKFVQSVVSQGKSKAKKSLNDSLNKGKKHRNRTVSIIIGPGNSVCHWWKLRSYTCWSGANICFYSLGHHRKFGTARPGPEPFGTAQAGERQLARR